MKAWGFLPLTENHSYSKRERTICVTFMNTCNGSFSQCTAFHYFCQKGHTISQFPGIVSASLLLCDVPFPWHFQFPVSYLPSYSWPGTSKTIESLNLKDLNELENRKVINTLHTRIRLYQSQFHLFSVPFFSIFVVVDYWLFYSSDFSDSITI